MPFQKGALQFCNVECIEMESKTVQTLIEERFNEMSPQLRRAAKYVLFAPSEVAMYPMRTVAESANVSPAALTRLATHLGYESFNALRDVLRRKIVGGLGPERYAVNARNLMIKGQIGEPHGEDLRELLAGVLTRTGKQFSAELVDQINSTGTALSRARKIYVIGFRNNHAAAFYFHYVTTLLRSGVELVEGRYGMVSDDLLEIGPEDAALIISFEPYTLDAVRCTNMAHEAGATVFALTDSIVAPVAKGAAEVLVSPNVGIGFYQSSIPAMAILETLAHVISKCIGEAGVQRVSERFACLASEGIYWAEGSKLRDVKP